MGAGKSTLLKRLCPDALDLDDALCVTQGVLTISELIENMGLEKFRELEAAELKRLVQEGIAPKLIALGGGTLDGPAFQWLISQQEASQISLVWLDTSFEVCWSRIKGDKGRPLVKLGKTKLQELFTQRRSRYAKALLRLDESEQLSLKTMADLQFSLTKIDGRKP